MQRILFALFLASFLGFSNQADAQLFGGRTRCGIFHRAKPVQNTCQTIPQPCPTIVAPCQSLPCSTPVVTTSVCASNCCHDYVAQWQSMERYCYSKYDSSGEQYVQCMAPADQWYSRVACTCPWPHIPPKPSNGQPDCNDAYNYCLNNIGCTNKYEYCACARARCNNQHSGPCFCEMPE
jgi:hypothetical protein